MQEPDSAQLCNYDGREPDEGRDLGATFWEACSGRVDGRVEGRVQIISFSA